MLESVLTKWLMPILLAAFAVLAPIHTLMGAVGVLIAADFVTGLAAAWKRDEKITSRAMSRTIWKGLGYQVAVISGFALEFLVPGGLPVAKLVASAIGLSEMRSLAENVETLTGMSLKDVIAKVVEKKGGNV